MDPRESMDLDKSGDHSSLAASHDTIPMTESANGGKHHTEQHHGQDVEQGSSNEHHEPGQVVLEDGVEYVYEEVEEDQVCVSSECEVSVSE